jgi:hypothetical protein
MTFLPNERVYVVNQELIWIPFMGKNLKHKVSGRRHFKLKGSMKKKLAKIRKLKMKLKTVFFAIFLRRDM